MVWVTATKSFDHDGKKKRGDQFETSAQYAAQLKRQKLVTVDGDGPKSQDGEPPSALPVVPASPLPTVEPSSAGAVTLPPPLPAITPPKTPKA